MDLLNIPEIKKKYKTDKWLFPILGLILCCICFVLFIFKINNNYFDYIYAFIIGLIMIAYPLFNYYLLIKDIKKLDSTTYNKLYNDFSNKNYSFYGIIDIIIFKEYIVSLRRGFKVFKISNIYCIKNNKNIIKSNNFELVDIDNKKHVISYIYDEKTKIEILKVYKQLQKINDKIKFL